MSAEKRKMADHRRYIANRQERLAYQKEYHKNHKYSSRHLSEIYDEKKIAKKFVIIRNSDNTEIGSESTYRKAKAYLRLYVAVYNYHHTPYDDMKLREFEIREEKI